MNLNLCVYRHINKSCLGRNPFISMRAEGSDWLHPRFLPSHDPWLLVSPFHRRGIVGASSKELLAAAQYIGKLCTCIHKAALHAVGADREPPQGGPVKAMHALSLRPEQFWLSLRQAGNETCRNASSKGGGQREEKRGWETTMELLFCKWPSKGMRYQNPLQKDVGFGWEAMAGRPQLLSKCNEKRSTHISRRHWGHLELIGSTTSCQTPICCLVKMQAFPPGKMAI